MVLTERIQIHKPAITAYLAEFLAQQRHGLHRVNRWGDDVIDRMEQFAGQGKVLRGGLMVMAAEMFGKQRDEQVLAMAAAIELMHASLLVHDDIMDNDRLRRGKPTIFAQYEQSKIGQASNQPVALGQALATCFGDLGFFMAWQLLSRSVGWSKEMSDLFGREMAAVCLAQMEDVAAGMTDKELTEEEIIAIYRYKTARYTFSLPLMCGARLADQSEDVLIKLEELGEYFGMMFQVKDDELGIFGDESQTGKSVGSDVAENKKTLWRLWLLQSCSDEQREQLRQIYGVSPVDTSSLELVRRLTDELAVRRKVDALMDEWAGEATKTIEQLPVADEQKVWLNQLADFNRSREK